MVERKGEGQDATGRQARATMRLALERMLRLEAGRGTHQAASSAGAETGRGTSDGHATSAGQCSENHFIAR